MRKQDIAIPADPNDPEDFDVTHEALEVADRSREIRISRHKSGLSQEKFARRFAIPLGTLRDWEQGRTTPPAYAVNYIRTCANHPEAVLEAA